MAHHRQLRLGSVCLSIVSMKYDEEDYVRDYNEFVALAKKRGPVI